LCVFDFGKATNNRDKLEGWDEIEHDENVTQWDDYRCEILPYKFGTSYPEKPGQVMTVKNQIINR